MSKFIRPRDQKEAERMVLKLYKEKLLLEDEADMYKKYFFQTLQLNEQLKKRYGTDEGLDGYAIDFKDEKHQQFISARTKVRKARYRFVKRVEVLRDKLGDSYGERVAKHIINLAILEAQKYENKKGNN